MADDNRTKVAGRTAAQRRKLPRAEREQQMLQVAARVFGQHGFHAASMDEIARGVGVTKPMLYAYFDSKEGLYLATVEKAGQHLVASVEALLGEPDPRSRLRMGTHLLLRFIDRYRDSWAVLYTEGLGGAPVSEKVTGYRNQISDLTAITLATLAHGDGTTDEQLAKAKPYAQAVLSGGEAIARWWLLNTHQPLEVAIEMATDVVEGIVDRYLARTRSLLSDALNAMRAPG
jgi:AcrR family transcriptional regulator